MANNPEDFKIDGLKSFRLMKLFQSPEDKGLAFVKVKSLDPVLCKQLQKLRSRYILATAECYFNSPKDIENVSNFAKFFDLHMVSSEKMRSSIQGKSPGAKCLVLGAGEFMTSADIFKVKNVGERSIDFLGAANSFWKVKNFDKILEMQRYLKQEGIKTTSVIACGTCKNVEDRRYYDYCNRYIDKNIPGQSRTILGASIEELTDLYNDSKFLTHFSSIDSSPRVVFEAMLCGCQCILSGHWTDSLNDWKKSPLIHIVPDNTYTRIPHVLKSPPDYDLAKTYGSKIGLVGVFPRIEKFIQQHIQTGFSSKDIVDQAYVGKSTFRSLEKEYATEISFLKTMLKSGGRKQ